MRIGNCKLSYEICDRLMPQVLFIKGENEDTIKSNNINSTEFDLLLYSSLKQDPFGRVVGIHYKDIKIDLGFKSKQTFYNVLKGLERKGYIKINYSRHDEYWEFTILNNQFLNKTDDKKGYFNTNCAFLFTSEFRNLKVNEKKICLKLAMSYQEEHSTKFGLKIYPKTIAKWLGIKTTSLIYGYMENVNQFFPNIRQDGVLGELVCFSKGTTVHFLKTNNSEREHHLIHKVKYFCKTFRVAYTINDLRDLVILMAQYANKGIGKLYSTISEVLISKRSIEPALINKILSGNNG